MKSADIAALRKEYAKALLNEHTVLRNPLEQFSVWLDEAVAASLPEPTAMALASVNDGGAPSVRMVLLKGVDHGFVFYTNYNSRKGTELLGNHNTALLFFWPELERQVRIEGIVEKSTAEESTAYFDSRPRDSRIGAHASAQSSVIQSREELDEHYALLHARFDQQDIPRPDTWGGFRVIPHTIEFWQGRPSRLHDRLRFRKQNDDWLLERLSP
ncbi:MAG: pyridoxamine 5'-phosphate oxidase [Chlorobi bacterium]|nr:MAG: pyridoxamine 5'-phosphate oxidase [Bacteroidota bacterium]MBE2266536.1 pyridoxamine 5'-phosphate oxidase [Flavobacteriales bacterium]MBL1162138.1 pyridoxamine 5'-phosphate oxidase [Chlorobiota bacterium]MBW7854615.1 pyridoxamine 5'-phosphate oxidase [Candidatus Kapabacteria bacterium]MCC6332293.1 pyridoxamine 5'-phosphate oxidase [Ignavibacteria bacterium]